jgi:RNA polymerase sigma factor (sigma-70 family)
MNTEIGHESRRSPLRSGQVSTAFAQLLSKYGGSAQLLRRVEEVADDHSTNSVHQDTFQSTEQASANIASPKLFEVPTAMSGSPATWTLTALVTAAVDHDEDAWNELVHRFASQVASTVRRYPLSSADAQEVSQLVWLRLVEHLSSLREPAALPAWLSATTRHECERYLEAHGRSAALGPPAHGPFDRTHNSEADESLLADGRRSALVEGLAELTERQRALILMLTADPPYSYAEISRALEIPVGSIGPTRSRIIARLRKTGSIPAFLGALERSDRRE